MFFSLPLPACRLLCLALLLGLAACGPSGDDDDNSPEPGPAPVQVFLMAGQSNMVGHGPLTDAGTGDWPLSGSLQALVDGGQEPESLLEPRDDAWVHFASDGPVRAPGLLQAGFGVTPDFLGPELGLGERLGGRSEAPIVMFKSAVGGTTLGGDWRPPSTVALSGGSVGPLYTQMLADFGGFLGSDLQESFPEALDERGYELAGFVWLQGWNDQFVDGFVDQYEDNLVALVGDVREALEHPDLLAVIVEGPTLEEDLRGARVAAVGRLEAERPGRTVLVTTEDLVEEEVEGNFHFHFNAGNYLEVGRRIADALP